MTTAAYISLKKPGSDTYDSPFVKPLSCVPQVGELLIVTEDDVKIIYRVRERGFPIYISKPAYDYGHYDPDSYSSVNIYAEAVQGSYGDAD